MHHAPETHPPSNTQTVHSIRGGEWPVFHKIVSDGHPFTNFQVFSTRKSHIRTHCRYFSHILNSRVNSMFRVCFAAMVRRAIPRWEHDLLGPQSPLPCPQSPCDEQAICDGVSQHRVSQISATRCRQGVGDPSRNTTQPILVKAAKRQCRARNSQWSQFSEFNGREILCHDSPLQEAAKCQLFNDRDNGDRTQEPETPPQDFCRRGPRLKRR